jgi:eukaryotic-like serine/threonine-protein kinase
VLLPTRRCIVPQLPTGLAEALRDRYLLERELGHGGMATVYLAHDVRHDRRVALKVLRAELTASLGPERFQREIHVTAQLQHPHILPVHDSGETDGRLWYVMPFVEGESLRQRLAREGELPVAETVRLLVEIVEALAYAHAQGVIHRDIKPDNILLSGRHALVADLGVAKAVSVAERDGEALTATGMALGTPRYMAPEQVAADPHVDQRADIYAVGVMAYEMLTGGPPFPGTTPQAVFAAQVTQAPVALDVLRPGIPPLLSEAVVKCLAARPADRWQSAAELLAELERVPVTGETTPTRQPARPVVARSRPWLLWAGGAAALAAVTALVALVVARRTPPEIHFAGRRPLTVEPGLEIDPAVSPDGQFVAYAAGPLIASRIYVRQADGGRPIAIAGDLPGAQRLPYWSPDGKRLAFRTGRGIEIAPALGGPSKVIVARTGDEALLPGPWAPDGRRIAFARSDSLFIIPAEGGAATLLARGGDMHSFAWSPDGRWIAAVRGNRQSVEPDVRWFFGNLGQSAVWLFPTGGGSAVRVTDDRSFHAGPAWLPGSRDLLFLSNADGGLDVYHVRLDHAGVAGRAERLTTGLNAFAMSMDAAGRRIAYSVFAERSNVWSMPVPMRPPAGLADAAQVTSGNQIVESFDLSPDGHWLAYDSDRSGVTQLYRVPLAGGEPEQLTTDSTAHFWPRWSPDGKEIAYHAFAEGGRRLFIMNADGSNARPLPAEGDDRAAEWRRDGGGLYYLHNFDAPDAELRFIGRDASGHWGSPETLLHIDPLPVAPSPDGRRLAISSDKGLLVAGLRGDSARNLWPVGYRAHAVRPTYVSWSTDGRTLYCLVLDSLDRASVVGIDAASGQRTLLVRLDDPARDWHRYGFAAFAGRLYFTLGDRQSDLWTASVDAGR